jgi:hypothetical protein
MDAFFESFARMCSSHRGASTAVGIIMGASLVVIVSMLLAAAGAVKEVWDDARNHFDGKGWLLLRAVEAAAKAIAQVAALAVGLLAGIGIVGFLLLTLAKIALKLVRWAWS